MHPVLPRTMVRGPAALAIIFISSADSQPWQVRWPEVKNSSSGSFLTDLNGSSFCVGSICTKVDMTSSLSFLMLQTGISKNPKSLPRAQPRFHPAALLTQTNPLRKRLRLAGRRLVDGLGHFL